MGIISDTYEDTRDRYADAENLVFFLPSDSPPQPPLPTLYTCPLCYGMFEERTFNQHLLRRHASEQIYLRVDGRIIRDRGAASSAGGMRECELVVVGVSGVMVSVVLDGRPTGEVHVQSALSLLPYIPAHYDGVVCIRVGVDHQTREFTVHCGRQARFDFAAVDGGVSGLQRALDHGTEPDWDSYRRQWISSNGLSELEKRYARGFYAYSLAMWLGNRGEIGRSRQHLEEAFTLLSPFDTPLARTALGILAIRMNAFDYLRQWKPFSRLRLACTFFVDCDLNPRPVQLGPLRSTMGEGIYADAFVETYLDALLAFYAEDAHELERCLVVLEYHKLRYEPNNEVKFDLLKARTLVRAGRALDARVFYEHLESDPLFGHEAQEHLI